MLHFFLRKRQKIKLGQFILEIALRNSKKILLFKVTCWKSLTTHVSKMMMSMSHRFCLFGREELFFDKVFLETINRMSEIFFVLDKAKIERFFHAQCKHLQLFSVSIRWYSNFSDSTRYITRIGFSMVPIYF